MRIAFENKNIEIFTCLLNNKNTNPNLYYNGSTILYDAVKQKNTDIVKLLLSNENIDVNEGHILK